ncbi:MAG: DinB family protein [Flavobacteriales bacterium]
MNHTEIATQLKKNSAIFSFMFNGVDVNVYNWKPAPEKWSLLEILCHLYDEEREDFRARLKLTLENPENPLPSIDPAGWVASRKYAEWNYNDTLRKFMEERENSVVWLKSLKGVNWQNTHHHPKFGELSAEMFLQNWLAHDYLHLRQIIKTKYDYLRSTSNVRFDYAGSW